jgi:large conductance mechanosensitive channel
MGFFSEFKSFALKDNVIELAVAVVIGAAFGDIVSSLVDDVITPLILIPATEAAGVADVGLLSWKGVKYGKLISAVIKFFLIALSLFIVIKAIKKIDIGKTKNNEA